eukprot:Em0016g171a
MPARLEALLDYVAGKKFTKLKAVADLNYNKLEPLIIPSAKRNHQMFCCLTNRYIGKQPAYIEKHTSGRRYKKALEKYNAGKLSLFKESGGKGGRQDVPAAEEALGRVEDEMGTEELGSHLSESGEEEVDELQLAERVSMEIESTGGNSVEEVEEEAGCGECQEDNHKKKQKLKRTKKSRPGCATHLKQRQTNRKKTALVTSQTIKEGEPGDDDACTRKRKKTKSNSRFKQAKLAGVA